MSERSCYLYQCYHLSEMRHIESMAIIPDTRSRDWCVNGVTVCLCLTEIERRDGGAIEVIRLDGGVADRVTGTTGQPDVNG